MVALREKDTLPCAPPSSMDHTLDDIKNLCSLDNRQRLRPPTYTLGTLEQLPLEILCMVLAQLEIRSLTDFRRVNQRARQVVDSIPQYKSIIQHSPASIQGCLSIGTGGLFSCQDLYDKLCTPECDICCDVGVYLYLITCRRVCYLCFTEKPDYLPLLRTDAIRKFGLSARDIASLPSMRSVPGRYSPRDIHCRTRLTLIDHTAARQAGIAVHGTLAAMEQYASEITSKKLEQYESRRSIRLTEASRPRRPRAQDSFDGRSSNPKRFMGIVRAPFLDSTG